MKKRTLWTALLLTAVMCMNPVWMEFSGSSLYTDRVCAEEKEESEEEEEYQIDPTVDSNDFSGWPQADVVECDAAICFDADTSTVLYAKHIDSKEYPASITKIMTVLLALEHGNLEDIVTFSENAVYSIEYGSAHLGLTEGEELTLEQCLYGIMLASANEISNAVAEHIGGSVEQFAEMMNQKAAELGCTNTHFVNPNGLHDENHYTCAKDMALIMQAALKYDKFREIIHTEEYFYPETNLVDEKRYFVNHHGMLTDEARLYDGIIGGKTGFTDQAWNTLVTAAERDGRLLISVVLHAPGQESEYGDTKKILDYGFGHFTEVQLNNLEQMTSNLEITGVEDPQELEKIRQADFSKEPFTIEETTTVTLPEGVEAQALTKKMDIASGKLTYYYGEQALGSSAFSYSGNWEPVTEAPTEPVTETESETEASALGRLFQNSSLSEHKVLAVIAGGYDKADRFIKEHTIFAVLAGAGLLIIFIPLLLVSISRDRKYKKMIELRTQEMALRRRLEAEIEAKSAAQVEAELRARELQLQLEKARKESSQEEMPTEDSDLEAIGEKESEILADEILSGEATEEQE